MGISEYIASKKTSKQIKRKENIVLLKPIVTMFVGDFDDEEDYLIKLLNDRIGSSNKVSFGKFEFGKQETIQEDNIKILAINDVMEEKEYSIKERNRIIKEVEESKSIKDNIGDYVNAIFNETLKTAYAHRAQISLNFIVQLDSMKAAGFGFVVNALKQKFLEYFTNGVTIDFYCILDQYGYKNDESEEEKKAFSYLALNEIKKLAQSEVIDMPYILSNYVSTYHLDLNNRIDALTAVALTMLLKNGKSVKENAFHELYNDDSFRQECKASEGDFYSLGYIKLQVSEAAIEYTVYKTVFEHIYQHTKKIDQKDILAHLEIGDEYMDNVCNSLIQITSFPDQIFYSMIKDKNVKVASMLNNSRSNVIEAIYGKSLNQFMKLNNAKSEEKFKKLVEEKVKKLMKELRDMYVEKKYSLAEMYHITRQIERELNHLCAKYEQKYRDYYQGFENWLSENSDVFDSQTVKDTGEPKAFYIIGRQYLNWLLELEVSKNTNEFMRQFYKQIKQSVTYYSKQSDIVKEAISDLKTDIEVLEQDGLRLCTENLCNYYTDITNEILNNNLQFDTFKRNLNNDIDRKEIQEEKIYERVIQYCDEHILTDSSFEKDFSQEMVKRLLHFNEFTSVEKVYDFAFETIMQNRKYYASHTEFGEIHQEVCFLVNLNNQFVNSTNARMQKLKTTRQLKLFFEKYFDGMDVLFMEGCFDIEKLFNYTVYEKIYQNLLNKE